MTAEKQQDTSKQRRNRGEEILCNRRESLNWGYYGGTCRTGFAFHHSATLVVLFMDAMRRHQDFDEIVQQRLVFISHVV